MTQERRLLGKIFGRTQGIEPQRGWILEPGVAKLPRVYGSPSINPEGVASVPHVSLVKGNAVLFQTNSS